MKGITPCPLSQRGRRRNGGCLRLPVEVTIIAGVSKSDVTRGNKNTRHADFT